MFDLPNVEYNTFVRASTGGVDVDGIVAQVTPKASEAATTAAVKATQQALPALFNAQADQLKQDTKQEVLSEVKPDDLYAEYQSGIWNPQASDVISGSGNASVFKFNFPKAFSTKPVMRVTYEGTLNRSFRLGTITATYFEWSANYNPLQVTVMWEAFVPKP